MSGFDKKYYPHPYLTSDGSIGYKNYPYPCSKSKSMDILGQALNISIPKLYHTVLNDKSSSPDQIKKATNLYNKWETSLVPEPVPEPVFELVPKPSPKSVSGTVKLVPDQLIEKMDENNSRVAKIVNEKGWEEGVNEMMKGLTYSEMRAKYG